MSCSRFSIRQAYAYAFATVVNNFWQYVKLIFFQLIALVGELLIPCLVGMLTKQFIDKPNSLVMIGMVSVVLSAVILKHFVRLSYLRACLDIHDYTRYELKNIWAPWRLIWASIVASLIFTLFFYIGLLALIIPGLLIWAAYCFHEWVIVDKKLSGWQSLKESARLTKGCRFKIILFMLVSALIMILGLPFFGIGIPLATMANAYVYRRLQSLPVKSSTFQEELIAS